MINTNEHYHYTDEFVFFWGGPFSNWYKTKFKMLVDSTEYIFNCAEQAMMVHKAHLFNDGESIKR